MTDDNEAARVIHIDFYQAGKLPAKLADEAARQGFHAKQGIVAVKTLISSPPSYKFEHVGSKPEDIKQFMVSLAKEDGADLNSALIRAYSS